MISELKTHVEKYDLDIYNAVVAAGIYAQRVQGAGIDLGHFLQHLAHFLPLPCKYKFDVAYQSGINTHIKCCNMQRGILYQR